MLLASHVLPLFASGYGLGGCLFRRGSARSNCEGEMSIRVLGPHERGRFAPEAWGHLLALSGSGAINANELEHIVERALLQIDGRIALDDLRSLMEGAGFAVDSSDSDKNQTIH
jgi:uncharacterized protein Smg (DUF494 family)